MKKIANKKTNRMCHFKNCRNAKASDGFCNLHATTKRKVHLKRNDQRKYNGWGFLKTLFN